MNLIDEEDNLARWRWLPLLMTLFQTLLELTPYIWHRLPAHPYRENRLFVLQILRYIATYDTLGKTFYDSGLTCTRLTYQNRVVLVLRDRI